MTNATRAQIVAFVNAALVLVVSFGIDVTDAQQAGVTAVVNAALSLWIGLTYKSSPKRIAS